MARTRPKTPAELYDLAERAYARADARRAIEYFEAIRGHPDADLFDRLEALSGVAMSAFQLSDYAMALRSADELLRVGREHQVADAVIDGLAQLGSVHLEQGDLERAEGYFRELLQTPGCSHRSVRRGEAWLFLGKIHFERGEHADARKALSNAARVHRSNRNRRALADVDVVRGHLAHVTGQFSKALELARRARRAFTLTGDLYGKGTAWHLEGEVLQAQRRIARAIKALRGAEHIYREAEDPTNLSNAIAQRADVLTSAGRYDEAIGALDEAISTLRAVGNPVRLGPVLVSLGDVHLMRGAFDDALAAYAEGRRVLTSVDAEAEEIARAMHREADAMRLLGRTREAEELLGMALECVQSQPLGLVSGAIRLTLAQMSRNSPTTCREHLAVAREAFERARVVQSIAEVDVIDARLLAIEGAMRGALRAANRAAAGARTAHDPHGLASALGLRAAIYARLQKREESRRDAARARRILRRMGAVWNLADMDADLAIQYRAAGDERSAYAAAIRVLRTVALLDGTARARTSTRTDMVEAFHSAQSVILSVLRGRQDPAPYVERVEATRGVSIQIARRARGGSMPLDTELHRALVPRRRPGRRDLERLLSGALARTRENTVVVAWYPILEAESLDLLIATPSHGAWFCSLPPASLEFRDVLTTMLERTHSNTSEDWEACFAALARMLLETRFARATPLASSASRPPASIADALCAHPGCELDIVPHGWTFQVPWCALPISVDAEGTRRRLIERHLVRLRPRLPEEARERSCSSRPRRALVYGDDGRMLPAARDEAVAVANTLRDLGVDVVEFGNGSPLTLDALREEGARCDLMHLATHAEFDAGAPWQSWVQVGSATGDAQASRIRLDMLHQLGSAPETVILSACSTAVVDRSRLFDAVSVAHGFLLAGARTVVGSLWRVDDESISGLMRRLYAHRFGPETSDWDVAFQRAICESQAVTQERAAAAAERGSLTSASYRVGRAKVPAACWGALQLLQSHRA